MISDILPICHHTIFSSFYRILKVCDAIDSTNLRLIFLQVFLVSRGVLQNILAVDQHLLEQTRVLDVNDVLIGSLRLIVIKFLLLFPQLF